ncbi:hypothetical protein F4803DRAFT_575954 [Xylaria telfairii]|nr:hypothetical protein F4803DRAFT_575954 [Xylaria telfairii]
MYREAADEWPVGHTPPEVKERRLAELRAMDDMMEGTTSDEDGGGDESDDATNPDGEARRRVGLANTATRGEKKRKRDEEEEEYPRKTRTISTARLDVPKGAEEVPAKTTGGWLKSRQLFVDVEGRQRRAHNTISRVRPHLALRLRAAATRDCSWGPVAGHRGNVGSPRGVVAEEDGDVPHLVVILGAPRTRYWVGAMAKVRPHVGGRPALGGEQAAEGAAADAWVGVVLGQVHEESFAGVLLLSSLCASWALGALEELVRGNCARVSLAKMLRYVLGKGNLVDEADRPVPLFRRECNKARCVDLTVGLLHVAAELGSAVDDGRLAA